MALAARAEPLSCLCLIVCLSEAAGVLLAIQSLFKIHEGYAPNNGIAVPAISKTYSTLAHCVLSCARCEECQAISYRYTSDPTAIDCTMLGHYDSGITYLREDDSNSFMQQLSEVPYPAIALSASEYGVNCTASSELTNVSSCDKVWDNEYRVDLDTQWISEYEDSGGWIKLQWNETVDVIAVTLWNRCRTAEQCSLMSLRFDDELDRVYYRNCLSTNSSQDCPYAVHEYYAFSEPIVTASLNITCLEDCLDDGDADSWGIQEVIIWKLF